MQRLANDVTRRIRRQTETLRETPDMKAAHELPGFASFVRVFRAGHGRASVPVSAAAAPTTPSRPAEPAPHDAAVAGPAAVDTGRNSG